MTRHMLPALLTVAALGLTACGGGSGNDSAATACTLSAPPEKPIVVTLEPAFAGLSFGFPTALTQAPGSGSHWYLAERSGMVYRFENREGVSNRTTVLDLRSKVDATGEGGLLGLAFHPDFQDNGQVFVSYTQDGSPLRSYISRFRVGGDGIHLDPNSEQTILALDQPFGNHNGGHIAFGPDGFLYIGFGDGGSSGDPLGNGQDSNTLHGAMLRIDVDSGTPYAIPEGNPFADGGGRAEILAWGFRNPWRWSFDDRTGSLWLGDVGQREWEEVDCVVAGNNYGWNIREGSHCYDAPDCDTTGLTDPVAEYGHALGCSITGGFVYRGDSIPGLHGGYVYGDFCSGRIWALFRDPGGQATVRQLLESEQEIVSFARSHRGELYAVTLGGLFRLKAPAPDNPFASSPR